MHSVSRAVKAGSPLGRVVNGKVQPGTALLQPTKTIASQQRTQAAFASFSTTTSCRPDLTLVSRQRQTLLTREALGWTQRFYTTSPTSTTLQELEQLLTKGEYEGFQQTCLTAVKNPTKDVYHFLLRTLAREPKALAPLQSDSTAGSFDPLNSAVRILTDMNYEADILGKTGLHPDRETILLLLQVAGSKEASALSQDAEHTRWESTRVLVDAIRHGRVPTVMSTDQWELPDLNIELDQELWKSMFGCIHASATTPAGVCFKSELDTATYLMADQLCRSSDVQMDDQLWSYVVEAFGNTRSTAKLQGVIPRLPSICQSNPALYSVVAEALANCGAKTQAMTIMSTLYHNNKSLHSSRPFAALASQYAKIGDFEAIRNMQKMWETKGELSNVNQASLVELNRSMLSAIALTLDRMVYVNSKVFRDRQADTLPEDVLPSMSTSPQLNRIQFSEAEYLWERVQESFKTISTTELTVKDYDVMMRITTRLNLLQPFVWPLMEYASKLIPEMKALGLKPSKSTYHTLMETMARTREHGNSREDGRVASQITEVLGEAIKDGHSITSASEFMPLIEACFGVYTPSPFTARQWMYSNQLYPASKSALEKVEKMMQVVLAPKEQGKKHNKKGARGPNVQQYHDSTTLANVLAGLAHGDELDEVLKRWDDLLLQGVERDAKLYQTVIGASHRQEKLATYVLRNIRHGMAKERPPVAMTPEILAGLMNCCVRTQDAISARSLIAQYSSSGDIQKTSEWYMPMVRTCLMVDGMEDEGLFLLEEMRNNNMRMDVSSGMFYEFLMEYFVMKRMDYQAGREIFKEFVRNEQNQIKEILGSKEKVLGTVNGQQAIMITDKELEKRAKRLLEPVDHMVERVTISTTTASMLNLLVLSHIRERAELQEQERISGFGAGSQERLKDAQIVIHYLTGEIRRPESHLAPQGQSAPLSSVTTDSESSRASPSTTSINASSLLFHTKKAHLRSPSGFKVPDDERDGHSTKGRLVFVNKYVLGEYIDACIKEGSPEMLAEADWALNRIMPRVIKPERMAKDTLRLRQALENAHNRHSSLQQEQEQAGE
ncbi:MAG: hypothetical protein J3Q66DRAFT_359784 [Benniella sp.]|nr:MAG: hypothetical protein J3Q66DRAFT_359784 [Benniella sp.]